MNKQLCIQLKQIMHHSLPRPGHGSSLAEIDQAPRLAKFLLMRGGFTTSTWLGMFGGKTPKPVKLISDDKFVFRLQRTANWGAQFPTSWYVYNNLSTCWQLGGDQFTHSQLSFTDKWKVASKNVYCPCAGNWCVQCFLESLTRLSSTETRKASWNLRVQKPLRNHKHIRAASGLQLLVGKQHGVALGHTVMIIYSLVIKHYFIIVSRDASMLDTT